MNKKQYSREDLEIFAKNDPINEIVGREFVRRLVRDGHLKIKPSGGLNDNQRCETAGQS